MAQNQTPKKRVLSLTLNVIENRDSSFGNTKELALSGTCSCTCCFTIRIGGGNGDQTGGGGGDAPQEN